MALAGTSNRVEPGPWLRPLGLVVLAVAGAVLLAGLVLTLGTVVALALVLALAGSLALLIRPEAATLLTGFLLYVNFPAILTQEVGLPPVVAGGFILLLGFPLAHALVIQRSGIRVDSTLGLMLAFLGLLLLSTLAAVDTGVALERVSQYVAEGLLLYWLVVNVVRDGPTLRKLLWALLAAGALVAALSLYQELTGSYRQEFGGLAHRKFLVTDEGEPAPGAEGRQRRAQGPVDEPNRFAQILVVLVPLAVFLFRNARNPGLQLLAAALGAFTVVGVALTLSRGGVVTLALMAVPMVVFGWVRGRHLLAAIVALLAVAPLVSPVFLDRVTSIVDARHLLGGTRAARQQADGAIRGRTTAMLAALYVFRDHPLVGVGPGQFSRFYFVDYAQKADIKFRDIDVPRRAHNLYLELGAEHGVLGLGAFLAIAGLLMRRLWRARRLWSGRSREAADLSAALWLSLFGYLTMGFFLHLSYQRYYWFLVAIASAALHVLRDRRHAEEEEERAWRRSH